MLTILFIHLLLVIISFGLYTYGIVTNSQTKDHWVAAIVIFCPIINVIYIYHSLRKLFFLNFSIDKILRSWAIKGGILWVTAFMMPTAILVSQIGYLIGLSKAIIVGIQLPFLVVQLFSLFMIIKYNKEIY